MNRFPWNLRYESPLETPGLFYSGNGPEGPIVLPGKYHLMLTAGGHSMSAELIVLPDPRVKASAADMRKAFDLQMKHRDRYTDLHRAFNQIRSVRGDLESVRKRLAGTGQGGPLPPPLHQPDASMAPP